MTPEELLTLDTLIERALAEDRAREDVATGSLPDLDRPARGEVRVKAPGVLSGTRPFSRTFALIDPRVKVVWLTRDGEQVHPGQVVVHLEGPEGSLLRGERTALNFLGHLSGIATRTAAMVALCRPRGVELLDTRKTTPGMRHLDKEAVRHGGGSNHRMDLVEMAMLKENHIAVAGGITAAVKAVRAHSAAPIEVEVTDLREFAEACACGVDRIMLDHFTPDMIREAIALNRTRIPLEVSGNLDERNLDRVCLKGIRYVSSGAITHSAPALDFSMLIHPMDPS